jgi:hypothetical protein
LIKTKKIGYLSINDANLCDNNLHYILKNIKYNYNFLVYLKKVYFVDIDTIQKDLQVLEKKPAELKCLWLIKLLTRRQHFFYAILYTQYFIRNISYAMFHTQCFIRNVCYAYNFQNIKNVGNRGKVFVPQ